MCRDCWASRYSGAPGRHLWAVLLELVLRVPRRTGLLLALAGLVTLAARSALILAATPLETLGRASGALSEVALEETLEMLALAIYTLLDYLAGAGAPSLLDRRAGPLP
jgi:hypothetical protein